MTRRPLIAILLPDLRPGGAERMRINLAREWILRGFAVDFVLLQKRGELLDILPEKARVVNLDVRRFRSVVAPLKNYINKASPAVVLAAMWPLTIVSIISCKLSRERAQVVVSDHNTLSNAYGQKGFFHKFLLKWSVAIVYPFADERICVSRGVSLDLARFSGLSEDQFKVIYNPASGNLYHTEEVTLAPEELDLNAPLLLSVGSLKDQKNHKLLIEAFSKISKDTDAKLYIIGEGKLRDRLQSQIVRKGLLDRVVLLGYRSNPADWYRFSDVFVLSSDYEGFGNVLVEALEHGVPVVSTDCPAGPREILCDGRYGKLVPVGDVDALAASILDSLKETPDRAALQSRAESFSVKKISGQYLDVMFPKNSAGQGK